MKCRRHEPAVPVSLRPGDPSEFQQGDSRNTSPERGMDQGHQRAHGYHCSQWEQCRFERSRNEIREKCRGRAHQSPSPRRFLAREPYFSKYRSQHKINFVPERLCVQISGASSRRSAGKLQVCNPERQSHYSHQEAHKHGSLGAHVSSFIAEYGASFIACPNEAPVNSCEPDLYQLRQHLYWRPTGFSRSWSSERRRSRGWLLEKFVQLPKFWREPHRAKAQWHVEADQGLYPEFRERSVYKGLLDVSPRARVRHWR